ncbi:MAG: ETC complex I subunit [Caulobacteraceae bacterium]|nr:MAG: ETC complex I subunit [Caulobacteraceae bacterium]
MIARIYQPAKSAMQSGKGKTKVWTLEFEPSSVRSPDALMGWQHTRDMDGQVRLKFDTREDAVAYCQAHKIAFEVVENPTPKRIIKAYSDNFAFGRRQPWTH